MWNKDQSFFSVAVTIVMGTFVIASVGALVNIVLFITVGM